MGKYLIIWIGLMGLSRLAYTQGPEQSLSFRIDTAYVQQLIQDADRIPKHLFPDSAIAQYNRAVSLARKIHYPRGIVYPYLKIAEYKNEYKRDHAGSLATIAIAIPYLDKLEPKDQYLIPTLYNLMGAIRYNMALYDSAIYYFNRALFFTDSLSISQPALKAKVFSNIGAVFCILKQPTTGITYLQKALSVKGLDSLEYANICSNIGAAYMNISDISNATHWWSNAIDVYRSYQRKDKLQYLYANMSIGWLSPMHQDLKLAASYLDLAKKSNPELADNHYLVVQADAYLNYYKNNYKQAIDRSLRLMAIGREQGNRLMVKHAYWLLSYCYEHLGDKKNTIDYQKKYELLEDSLGNEEVIHLTNALEIKYRTTEKDKIFAEKEATLYKQQNWLIASIGLGALLLTILGSYLGISKQRIKLDAEKIKNLERYKEIEALSTRMDAEANERVRISRELHDGMGVLISAAGINYTLLKKQITPDTNYLEPIYTDGTEILERMRQEMYHVAHNLIPEYYLAHNGLVDALNNLIAHVANDNFAVQLSEFGIPREIHPGRGFILYRIMEEIITNALRHSGGSRLEIQFVYHDDKLHVLAEDNGKGFIVNNIQRGIGLENIERRVAQLNGIVNLYTGTGKGVSYSLEIPY